MLKRTPLFETHQKLGARLIDFGGWEMPVQYTSIVDEHLAVRKAAGIFDISHMGEVTVSGAAAADFLNHVLTNDIKKLKPGLGQYTLMCNEHGGTIDDLYAFRLSEEVYLLIINAGCVPKDVAWLQAQEHKFARRKEMHLTDASHNYAAVAVQGPKSAEIVQACITGASISGMRVPQVTGLSKNEIGGFPFGGSCLVVSRTGYTGEDGFELLGGDDTIRKVWDAVLAAGRDAGIKPCGLGSRDTLRTEVCYPLYGHELDEQTTPIEAGLGFFVAFDKGDFVGREPLFKQKENGVEKKCVAFKMAEKSAPPRPHYPIWAAGANGELQGEVTSGTQSPSLNAGIGMGYVKPAHARSGTPIEIEIRGKRYAATIEKKPLLRPKS